MFWACVSSAVPACVSSTPALVRLKQLHAQLFLKRLDVPGQRRLRDVQPFGGAADVALFCGDDKKLEPANIHTQPRVETTHQNPERMVP
jgi:hypothetical protein